MENPSQISSSSTKSKKSIISFFNKFFRRTKSSQTSRVSIDKNDEENDFTPTPAMNIHMVSMENRIEEVVDVEEISHSPTLQSYIEIVMNDISGETWRGESVNPRNNDTIEEVKESEIELKVTNTEEDITLDDIEKTMDEMETLETNTDVVIDIPELIKEVLCDDGGALDVPEHADVPEHLQILPTNIDTRYGGQDFTDEQLPQFCEQLHSLIEIIRNVQATSKSFTKYPRDLQKLLEIDAKELELIYCEIRCVKTTIEQIKKQRELITSGKLEAIEQLTILENEEFEEIEKSINIHDTPIYKTWERTKRSKTSESFDKLIKDIHSNQEALKNLEVLVRNRKAKINYMNKRFRSASGPVSDVSNANAVMPSNALVPSNELQYMALSN